MTARRVIPGEVLKQRNMQALLMPPGQLPSSPVTGRFSYDSTARTVSRRLIDTLAEGAADFEDG